MASASYGARFGSRLGARSYQDAVTSANPKTLIELNDVVAPWGATFSHAWSLDELSGNSADLALSGAVALAPANAPTQGVYTGLAADDRGVTFAAAGLNRMECPLGTDLDVTTGSVIVYLRDKLDAAPGDNLRTLTGKGGVNYYICRPKTTGHLYATVFDGTIAPEVTIAVDHLGAGYLDILWVLDRTSATKLMSLTSNLGDSGTVSVATLASLTSVNPYAVGCVNGIATAAPATASFAAWGTVPGTLVADRLAALKRLREVFGTR